MSVPCWPSEPSVGGSCGIKRFITPAHTAPISRISGETMRLVNRIKIENKI